TRGEERSLVHEVFEICTGKPRRPTCDDLEVHIGPDGDTTRMDHQDSKASFEVGSRHQDPAIETTGPQNRWVEHVGSVRRRNDDDPIRGLESVHFYEQLIQRLLPFVVSSP